VRSDEYWTEKKNSGELKRLQSHHSSKIAKSAVKIRARPQTPVRPPTSKNHRPKRKKNASLGKKKPDQAASNEKKKAIDQQYPPLLASEKPGGQFCQKGCPPNGRRKHISSCPERV